MTGAHGLYLRDGWFGVVVWVTLCHQFMWEGIMHWFPRQGIWDDVLDTLHPLGSEIVSHDAALELLETWILDVI